MILRTPDDFPPPDGDDSDKKKNDDKEPSALDKFCFQVGSFIVDCVIQVGMSFWWVWIILNITGRHIDQWLWALGMAIFCFTLHLYSPDLSGRVFIKVLLILGITTILIWFLK